MSQPRNHLCLAASLFVVCAVAAALPVQQPTLALQQPAQEKPWPHPRISGGTKPALQRQIDRALDRGARYLVNKSVQKLRKRGGGDRTAGIALYAALHSGANFDREMMARAISNFASIKQTRTYETATAIMALERGGSQKYAKEIQKLAKKLISTQVSGSWGYPGGDDLSNTQYAVLGLYAAQRAGAEVPVRAWTKLAQALRSYAANDGGFGYSRGAKVGSLSMTAAGVACASMCAEMLEKDPNGRDSSRHSLTVERLRSLETEGLAWLDEAFRSGRDGMEPMNLYAMYGIERVGGLTGRKELGDRNWYVEGALRLITHQQPDGSWNGGWGDVAPSAFAVLFLSRASDAAKRKAPMSGPNSTGR